LLVADALVVNVRVTIPAGELEWKAIRASGPGGQNVNKVASKVELRFDLAHTAALDAESRQRLHMIAAGRIDADGKIVVASQRGRSQEQNLRDAREKLRAMIARSLERPKKRKPTRPTVGSKKRRVEDKRRHSEKKRSRRNLAD
jgi:ribosome-associated protein